MSLTLHVKNGSSDVSIGFDSGDYAAPYFQVLVSGEEDELGFQLRLEEAQALRRLLDVVIAALSPNDNGKN